MAPWWLRASDDEQLADSPAELEAFAQEEDPILDNVSETAAAPLRTAEDQDRKNLGGFAAAGSSVVASEPAELEAEETADETEDGDGDAGGEAGEAGAKADGVRRRRRRRRGRRGDGAPAEAPAATAAPAAEQPDPPADEMADKVPLFDSPAAGKPPGIERAPLLATPEAAAPQWTAGSSPTATPPAEPPAPRHDEPAASESPRGLGGIKVEPFRLFVPPVSSVEPPPESPAGRLAEPYFGEAAETSAPRQPSVSQPQVSQPQASQAQASQAQASQPQASQPSASQPSGRRSSGPPPRAHQAPQPPASQPPAPPQAYSPPPPGYPVQPQREMPSYGGHDGGQRPMEQLPKAYYSLPERPSSPADERKIAMFVDFENIALGVRDSEVRTFDMTLILERLLEKGKIIVKKAYADWERYSDYKRPFHEAAIELIDIPQKFYSGKNSADIKMVVDAMDLCYSKEHLDTFVLVSGDSDFSPLVSKLKENNKYVIGLGVKNSSSSLLIDNCDEFIYYEDVWRDTQRVPRLDHLGPKEAECFHLMCESIVALLRENKEVLWGSLVKQTMQRKRPSFAEGYFGYGTFTELLEDAERKNIIRLRRDARSGTYIVVGFVPPRSKRSFQV